MNRNHAVNDNEEPYEISDEVCRELDAAAAEAGFVPWTEKKGYLGMTVVIDVPTVDLCRGRQGALAADIKSRAERFVKVAVSSEFDRREHARREADNSYELRAIGRFDAVDKVVAEMLSRPPELSAFVTHVGSPRYGALIKLWRADEDPFAA